MLGRAVVIRGSGPVSLCFCRIATYLGARPVVAVGRREERLALARQPRADTAPIRPRRFIRRREEAVHDLALNLVRLGFIDRRGSISQVLPLTRIDEACRLLAEPRALTITVMIDGA